MVTHVSGGTLPLLTQSAQHIMYLYFVMQGNTFLCYDYDGYVESVEWSTEGTQECC